ncbi:MAG: TraB/GumN family protein [Sphingomicrobium sp.]
MIMQLLKRTRGKLTALLSLAVLAGVAAVPAVQARDSGRPALWRVADRDTTIYLFGTIHLLPQNYQWRSRAIDKAVSGSNSLIVETIIDEKNPAGLAGELQRLGFRPGLPPIIGRVPADKRAGLEAAMAKSGVPRAVFDRMETWAAAFVLLGTQFKELGLQGGDGVESVLRGSFAAAGKPVGQLETNAEQLGFFDTLPESAQRALLGGAVDSPSDMRAQFQAMLNAWVRGDVEGIARSFNADLAASPELRAALLSRRNVNWSYWVQRRMATPGTVFVAVGAGHLAGAESVVALLQRSGYRVTRVQ